MNDLKLCSICGAPGVQMWDAEENIIKCSSAGYCHNALYGMYFNEWQSRPLEDAFRDAVEKVSAALHREIETSAEWERQYNHRMEVDQAEYDAMTSDYLRVREIAHGMEAAIKRTIEYFETSGFDDADAEAVKVLRDAIEALK